MRCAIVTASLLLSACAGSNNIDYLRMHNIAAPTPQSFTHCYNYGCQARATLSLPPSTLKKIDQLFLNPSTSEEQERLRIIQALQIFEKDIGHIVGTENDRRGTFQIYDDGDTTAKSFQQDCVDESTNTTTYLTLLNQMNYLNFYEPAFPANRHPLRSGNGWWHQTAVIKDKITGQHYAVDTWFEDNGVAGYILVLEEWKANWHPPKD